MPGTATTHERDDGNSNGFGDGDGDGDSDSDGDGDGDGDGNCDGDGDVLAKMKTYLAAASWSSSFLRHLGSKNSSLDPNKINGRISEEPT